MNGTFHHRSLVLKNVLKCSGEFSNSENIRSIIGEIKFSLNMLGIVDKFEIFESNNHIPFLCETRIHDIVVEIVHNELRNENSTIHLELVRRNYNVHETLIHVSNSTHVEVTFICVTGHHTKR